MSKKFVKVIAGRRRTAAGIILIIILIAGLTWRLAGAQNGPVPGSIRTAAGFTIYYPAQNRLPSGYALDTSSFKQAQPGVILYTIDHRGRQPLIVSEEAQPAGNVISDFTKNSIPLHTTVSTSIGQAQIGAYGTPPNLRTIVSLPINNGPWLIITAPSDTQQSDIKQIVQSLKQ